MKKDISTIISERLADLNSNRFATISYRPDHKLAAMIEIMCKIYGVNKANLFHRRISEILADVLLSSKNNIDIIHDIMEKEGPNNDAIADSALGILLEKKIITIDHVSDNPYIKNILQNKE